MTETGLELCGRFYREAVGPALAGVPHSAALLGRGSEVLGFDDEMSTDHDFKPRVLLFLRDKEAPGELPVEFEGRPAEVTVDTIRDYFRAQLDFDVTGEPEPRDWLTFPEQRLRMLTAGAVYHDDLGLEQVRERLAYYPRDVWLYLLAAAWWRVHPEVSLVGRAGYVGDELGSTLIGSRLVFDLMRLCFLIERQYAPYSKWFGTAFSRLDCAAEVGPALLAVQRTDNWREREEALVTGYELVAARQNALGLVPPIQLAEVRMWERPFKVVWADFPTALQAELKDPAVRALAKRWPLGEVDQLRDVFWKPQHRQLLLRIFD